MADTYQAVYDAVRSKISHIDSSIVERAAREAFDISFLTSHVQQEIYVVSHAMQAPHVLMRPAIYPDGNMWCALYGESLQEGVAGFGETPALACADFDQNWFKQKLSFQASSARASETPASGEGWLCPHDLLREAAQDLGLTDAAFRQLAVARAGTITPETEAWALAYVRPLPAPPKEGV